MSRLLHSIDVPEITDAISDAIGNLADLKVETQLKHIIYSDNQKIILNEVVITKIDEGFHKTEKNCLPIFFLGIFIGIIIGIFLNS